MGEGLLPPFPGVDDYDCFSTEKFPKLIRILLQLEKAHCELNKRIFEHDKCVAMRDENKIKITLQVCSCVIILLMCTLSTLYTLHTS